MHLFFFGRGCSLSCFARDGGTVVLSGSCEKSHVGPMITGVAVGRGLFFVGRGHFWPWIPQAVVGKIRI